MSEDEFDRKVTVSAYTLGGLLESTYRDLSLGCVNYRNPGCAQCLFLDEAELAVYGRYATYEERNWWTRRGLDRLRRWWEIRRWGKERRGD